MCHLYKENKSTVTKYLTEKIIDIYVLFVYFSNYFKVTFFFGLNCKKKEKSEKMNIEKYYNFFFNCTLLNFTN